MNPPREALYDRLNRRCAEMFAAGLVEETRALLARYGPVKALDALGYRHQYGGAQGTYGSGLGFKQAAAEYVAARGDAREFVKENRLLQMDRWQRVEPAQLDLPFLATMLGQGPGNQLATNSILLVVDDNRTSYDASRVGFGGTGTNFGPVRVYIINRQ